MGLGNGNPKNGNKGSNFNYEMRHLTLLSQLKQELENVKAAVNATKDFELNFVRDTGNSDLVIREVTVYDQGTGSYTTMYEDVYGAPYLPMGALEYLDPTAVLNLLYDQFIGSVTVTRVDISGNAAYAIPTNTYNSWELIVTSGTVSDGIITYPEGVWSESAPLNKLLTPGLTLNATGATAYIKLMV